MSATNSSGKRTGSIVAIVASVVLLLAAALLYSNRQYLTDQVSVWVYSPTQAVQDINNTVDFSNKGTFYFYATQPEVATAEAFNQDCPRQESSSPILGCYVNNRIYIYDVTNQQLDGIEEVTAAHEMLHAVWDRLGNSEKQRLTTLLQDEYQKHATGELATRMAYYERNEPGQVTNELHSILPTEVKDLSPELEAYYMQYFDDRQKVVTLHDRYSGVLSDLTNKITTLYEQLTTLSASIESASAAYTTQTDQLSTGIAAFNSRAQNGGFTTQQQFNSERSLLLNQSAQLESSRNAINEDIDRYNDMYGEYQDLATQLDSLNKSLDSITNLPQIPTIEE